MYIQELANTHIHMYIQELGVFSKLHTRKWPNLEMIQKLLESALGAQKVSTIVSVLRAEPVTKG